MVQAPRACGSLLQLYLSYGLSTQRAWNDDAQRNGQRRSRPIASLAKLYMRMRLLHRVTTELVTYSGLGIVIRATKCSSQCLCSRYSSHTTALDQNARVLSHARLRIVPACAGTDRTQDFTKWPATYTRYFAIGTQFPLAPHLPFSFHLECG